MAIGHIMLTTNRIYLFLLTLTDSMAFNVALNKHAVFCGTEEMGHQIFDTLRNVDNYFETIYICEGKSYIEVDLVRKYSIQYVVIFQGGEYDSGQLDHHVVYSVIGNRNYLCSEYPSRGDISYRSTGMRVNCRPSMVILSNVIIRSTINAGFGISELEIHSLAQPDEGVMLFRGCYRAFQGTKKKGSFEECGFSCLVAGFMQSRGCLSTRPHPLFKTPNIVRSSKPLACHYRIIDRLESTPTMTTRRCSKSNLECVCSKGIVERHRISAEKCNAVCDRNMRTCGGPHAYSVYIVKIQLPYYFGCVESEEVLPGSADFVGKMSIYMCLLICDKNRFALIQNAFYCFCKDQLGRKTFVGPKNCDMRCANEPDRFCGGEEHATVYRTCSNGEIRCTGLLQCLGSWNTYGTCDVACKEGGFAGEFCMETETNETRGLLDFSRVTDPAWQVSTTKEDKFYDACEKWNPCRGVNTKCVTKNGIPKCVCQKGYVLKKMKCDDVDECSLKYCDPRISYCINYEGSYQCRCFEDINISSLCIPAANATYFRERYFGSRRLILYLVLISILTIVVLSMLYGWWWKSQPSTSSSETQSAITGVILFPEGMLSDQRQTDEVQKKNNSMFL